MTDVESSSSRQPARRSSPGTPYQPTTTTSRWDPLHILQRGAWIGGALWLLDRWEVYQTVTTSPEVSHEWFKVGLAASIALLFVKAYVELYTGKLQKQEVSYKTMPQSTHAAILLLLLSGVAFHVALWPVYGAQSMLVVLAVSTFLLNFCLLFPTIVQNIVAFVVLTFFLQEYQ